MEKQEGEVVLIMEEQVDEDETLLLRKSRIVAADGSENKCTDVELSNGTESHKSNGHEIVNGDNNKFQDEAEARTENLVVYDKDEGIWKCRICTWTYQNGSVCVDLIQNHKEQLHKLMIKVKSLNFQNKGKQIVKDDNLPSPNIQPSEILFQEELANYKSSQEIESVQVDRNYKSSEEIESVDINQIKGDEIEVTEIDVEKVLQKQNTHDLFCPNCNSCITRRVILRKRKRRTWTSDEEVERNKTEAAIDPNLVAESVQGSTNQVDGVGLDADELPTLHDEVADKEPDIFRCLSCFSFFIPNGDGFKLFRIFGDKSLNENAHGEKVTSSTKKNWFTSMFAFNKQEASVGEGSNLHTDAGGNDARIPLLSELGDQRNQLSSGQKTQVLAQSNLKTDAQGTVVKIPLLSELSDQRNQLSSGQKAQVLGQNNLKTDEQGSVVRIPLLSELDDQRDWMSSGQKAQVLAHSNLQTDAGQSDVRIPSELDDQSDRPSSGQTAQVAARSSLQADAHGSDVKVPVSSELGDQNGRAASGQKAQLLTHTSEVVGTSHNNNVVESRGEILLFPRLEPALNGNVIIGSGDKADEARKEKIDPKMEHLGAYTREQLKDSKYSTDVQVSHGIGNSSLPPKRTQFSSGESAEDSVSISQGGLNLLISTNQETVNPPKSDEHDVLNHTLQLSDKETLPISTLPHKAPDMDGASSNSVGVPHTVTEHRVGSWILTQSAFNNTNATLSVKETGKDTIITINAHPAESSQTQQGINTATEPERALLSAGTPIVISGDDRTERKEFQIEVIKSVVYGGLGESIASLSIVSSAAGGDAATLNILALATANLIGGLFIIFHNLWELRNDHIEQQCNQVSEQALEPRDRYREVLGRRANFILHTLIAILSYLIFGLLPPVVYGFSFSKSNDKELKLLMVAAVSLPCIVMLATARAYVQTPRKRYLKTILTFVILGFTVSGVSYAGGVFIKRLLEKLHVFQPSSVSRLSEIQLQDNKWASY